jgi:hypothetical protein
LTNLEALGKRLCVNVVAVEHDEGESGDDLERPGLLRSLAIVEGAHRAGRPIRVVLVDKSDRLSRADSLDTGELLARLRRWGVRRVATPAKVFDLHNALDRTLVGIEADHKNNPFLKDMARTVLNGMLDVARLGLWTGGPVPFGYCLADVGDTHGRAENGRKKRRRSRRLVIDPVNAPLLVELFERCDRGEQSAALLSWFGAATGRRWTRGGLNKLLRKEMYAGVRAFGTGARGKHVGLRDGTAEVRGESALVADVVKLPGYPALIERALFNRVQERLSSGKGRGKRLACRTLPLSGLARCGVCLQRMGGSEWAGHAYYRCSASSRESGRGCSPQFSIRQADALARVLRVVGEQLLHGDTVARLAELAAGAGDEARAVWERERKASADALDVVTKRLAKQRERLDTADDDIRSEYEASILRLRAEQERLTAEVRRVVVAEPATVADGAERLETWLQGCRTAVEQGASLDPKALNALLLELIEEVRFHPPAERNKSRLGIGEVEVVLPEWLSSVVGGAESVGQLSTTAGRSGQQAHNGRITLTDPDPTAR